MTNFKSKLFIQWLGIDIKSISWENKYKDQFDLFWSYTFDEKEQFDNHFTKIKKFIGICQEGPFKSWLLWLQESYVIYLFQYYNFSIIEISKISRIQITDVSFMLRAYFIDNMPAQKFNINNDLSIISPQNSKAALSFKDLVESYNITEELIHKKDQSLKELEVTLLKSWVYVYEVLPKKEKKIIKSSSEIPLKKQISFFQELLLLFVLSGVLILGIKFANKWYEDYLTKQVTLFESNFFWLDKNLVFESQTQKTPEIELSFSEIDKLEKTENNLEVSDKSGVIRYEDESDVVVTSVQSLPQNFEIANMEQSSYEEKRKGGYRDFSYGRRRAYRVMLTSVKPGILKSKLYKILNNYSVRKADNVDPGKKIPGGIYFNLYISRAQIKKFLSEMDGIEATILESKTIFGGPRNMDKVFIWIKEV